MLFVLAALFFGCSSREKPKKARPNPANHSKHAVLTSTPNEKPIPIVETKTTTEATTATEPAEDNKTVVPPEEIEKANAIIASVSAGEIEAVDALGKYKMYCAACHGYDGRLKVNGAKDLSKSVLALEESVAQLYHGRGLMPPFKTVLQEPEIVAIAQYIERDLRK